MTRFAEEQLHKCKNVHFPEEIEQECIVAKRGVRDIKTDFEVGHTYLIKLATYILHPSENFTLADNWNSGIIPESEYMQATVIRIMGKMICFNSVGIKDGKEVEGENYSNLWLPRAGIQIVDKEA